MRTPRPGRKSVWQRVRVRVLAPYLVAAVAVMAVGSRADMALGAVYWTAASDGSIGRANVDGSSPDARFLTTVRAQNGVAVDDHFIYWSNPLGSAIGRASIDGGNANQVFIAT